MLNIQKHKDEILKYAGYQHSLMCLIYENIMKKNDCTGCCSKCKRETIEWLTSEYKEPILTDKEKGYLKNVIEPLGVEVRYIKKWKSIAIEENKCCYNIAIAVKHPIMETWERDLMNFAVTKEMPFNRLELDKRYSLKDLGL